MRKWGRLFIAIMIPVLTGTLSGLFTVTGTGSWYQDIQKPSWNPPNWVFGPVWTTLYILMGIGLYLVWNSKTKGSTRQLAILLFSVQLILNFFWSLIFFKWHAIGLALAEIIILWLAILWTIFLFAKNDKRAAWLMVPYISWVSFASLLTYTLWVMNR